MARRHFIVLILHIIVLSILESYAASVDDQQMTSGCTASPLLPDQPFVVVWNHPTYVCENKGIHLDFARWGIVDNTRDRFFGQQIVLFYNLGKWPYYDSKGQPVNGGLPQLSDLQAHLTKVDADLKTNVWNRTFGGLGVIDMEHWRPLYWTNYDSHSIYQRQSLALASLRFPAYNKTQVLAEAIKEFNKAARDFMRETLQRASSQRPDGKWGYYLFPQCFDASCNTSTVRNNDRISWLFQESSALYPSIYFKLATPTSSVANRIKQTLKEAFRVKAKYSSQTVPVMPYTKSQEGPFTMYKNMDLSLAVLQPANMGTSGAVIWGSSSDVGAKNECLILQDYLHNMLGPYVRNVTHFMGNCSQQLCNAHGRCVRKDYERVYQRHLYESGRGQCRIPEEELLMGKDGDETCKDGGDGNSCDVHQDVTSSNTVTDGAGHGSQRKGVWKRNKVLGFVERIKNYLSLNIKFRHRNFGRFSFRHVRDRRRRRKTIPNRSSLKSVIKFSVQPSKENMHGDSNREKSRGEEVSMLFSNEKSSARGVSDDDNLDLGDEYPGDKTGPTFESNAPFYDFDDYVCKCYQGFSGSRCDNKLD